MRTAQHEGYYRELSHDRVFQLASELKDLVIIVWIGSLTQPFLLCVSDRSLGIELWHDFIKRLLIITPNRQKSADH